MIEALAQSQQIANAEEEGGIAMAVSGDLLRNGDVRTGVQRRQQVELLKYESDLALAHAGALGIGERGEIVAVEDYLAGIGAGEAAEQIEESGLAAAGGADHGDEFSFLHVEGDAAEGGDVNLADAISLVQVNGFDECAHA